MQKQHKLKSPMFCLNTQSVQALDELCEFLGMNRSEIIDIAVRILYEDTNQKRELYRVSRKNKEVRKRGEKVKERSLFEIAT